MLGGSLSDSSDGAIIAAKTAKNAVENNYLWENEQKEFEKKMLECKSKGEDCTSVVNEYLDKSNKRSRELYERCKDGGVGCAGMEEVIDVSTNIARAKYDTSGRLFLGDALQDDDTIKVVNYVNERDLTFLKDRVSATDRMLYQASDITNWPFYFWVQEIYWQIILRVRLFQLELVWGRMLEFNIILIRMLMLLM